MNQRVLITGGAGFIGSHVADELLQHGYQVRALDCLTPQVHGPEQRRPAYLAPAVELQPGDVRDAAVVAKAVAEVDAVIHLASAVGVGQSMYAIAHYTSVNNLGTAVLLETLISARPRKLIVASSMSVYGEGLYRTADGRMVAEVERSREQLRAGRWEPRGRAGELLQPIPTPETKPPSLSSVYALSKYDQEQLCLLFGRTYGVPTIALRFFNVYGPRQALANPYTGVLAIFASRLLSGRPPLLYEDGEQRRDFVSVHDVARACVLALETTDLEDQVLNIGSGRSYTVKQLAQRVAAALGRTDLSPQITDKYRAGDIRHCYADITRARKLLGYRPQVSLGQGLVEMAEQLAGQATGDRLEQATIELAQRGLIL